MVELLLSDANVPDNIITALTKALLEAAIIADETQLPRVYEVLSSLRQRHPGALQSCTDSLTQNDEGKRLAMEKVVLDITMVRKFVSRS